MANAPSNKKRNIIIGIVAFLGAGTIAVLSHKGNKTDNLTKLKNKNTMNLELLDYIKKYFKKLPFPSTGDLNKDAVNFTLQSEGGLTDNPSDAAHIDPVGVSFTYKGKTTNKWHTNKGITWTAFKKHFGAGATAQRFYNMSNEDWFSVWYKDYVQPFSTFSNNKLVNIELGLWAWGSGVGGATQSVKKFIEQNGSLQALIDQDKNDAFEKIILHRIKFFENIVTIKETDKPAQVAQRNENKKFLPGWINRSLNFYENFKQYA